MTTMSSSSPPEASTNRRRMLRSFSLFSAPPIGTIQPRVLPSTTLLGHIQSVCSSHVILTLFKRAATNESSILDVNLTLHDDRVGVTLFVEHDQVGVVAGGERSLASEPEQLGRICRKCRKCRFERQAARQCFAQRFQQRTG